MLLLLAKLKSIGVDTADRLVHEAFYRRLRDRRAVARYGGMTGAPDESGAKRREKGLARAGNGRVRKALLQLAWRWIMFHKESALAQWRRERVAGAKGDVRKTMIIALARKLLIALFSLCDRRRGSGRGAVPPGGMKPTLTTNPSEEISRFKRYPSFGSRQPRTGSRPRSEEARDSPPPWP